MVVCGGQIGLSIYIYILENISIYIISGAFVCGAFAFFGEWDAGFDVACDDNRLASSLAAL